jgi:hypothetical protein
MAELDGCPQIDGEHRVPEVRSGLQKRANLVPARTADENVDRADGPDRVGHLVDRRRIREVTAEPLCALRDRPGRLEGPCTDGDAHARLRELPDDRGADRPRPARDDRASSHAARERP